jgi:hypothetical protein
LSSRRKALAAGSCFCHQDRGSRFLQNFHNDLQNYTSSYPLKTIIAIIKIIIMIRRT